MTTPSFSPDRIPVIVGIGEITDRPKEITDGLEPLALLVEALKRAEADSGAALLGAIDSLDVVNFLSWRYREPEKLLSSRLGIHPKHAYYGPVGGESPIRYLHEAAQRIARGESSVAAICGAEAQSTATRAERAGITLPWTPFAHDVDEPKRGAAFQKPMAVKLGVFRPVSVYPFYEAATSAHWGQTPREATAESGALWSTYSQVACEVEARMQGQVPWTRTRPTSNEMRFCLRKPSGLCVQVKHHDRIACHGGRIDAVFEAAGNDAMCLRWRGHHLYRRRFDAVGSDRVDAEHDFLVGSAHQETAAGADGDICHRRRKWRGAPARQPSGRGIDGKFRRRERRRSESRIKQCSVGRQCHRHVARRRLIASRYRHHVDLHQCAAIRVEIEAVNFATPRASHIDDGRRGHGKILSARIVEGVTRKTPACSGGIYSDLMPSFATSCAHRAVSSASRFVSGSGPSSRTSAAPAAKRACKSGQSRSDVKA
jgi:hypothetical protein